MSVWFTMNFRAINQLESVEIGVKCRILELGYMLNSYYSYSQTPSLTFPFTVKAQSCCICKRVLIKTPFPFSVVIRIRWTVRP